MYDQEIKLVSKKRITDEYGDPVTQDIERTVFAEEKSVSQTEFYQAQAAGFKPERKFKIADYLDYQGEKILKYKENTEKEEEYSIIRTYRTGNELEIVCKRGID